MTAFILLLGAIVIIAIQMAATILYMTTVMPPRGLLKVLARYLRHGEDEKPVDLFPPVETATRLLKIRRRVTVSMAALLAAATAAAIACGFYSPRSLAYIIPAFLVAALVLLVCAAVLTVWIRQCRAMREPDWMEEEER